MFVPRLLAAGILRISGSPVLVLSLEGRSLEDALAPPLTTAAAGGEDAAATRAPLLQQLDPAALAGAARAALRAVHAAGVLHGDAGNLGNYLLSSAAPAGLQVSSALNY